MKNIFLGSILALSFAGCTDLTEDVIDKIPTANYPENDAQIASVSVDAYARLKPLCDDEGWWFWAQEVSSDDVITSYSIHYTKLYDFTGQAQNILPTNNWLYTITAHGSGFFFFTLIHSYSPGSLNF